MPKLHYVLRGIKKHEAETGSHSRERLPVTPSILMQIRAVWELLWAACCLAFFGFMRAGELVAPATTSHDPSVHLCMADIRFDNPRAPAMLQVMIKQSKTDPFRNGVQLLIGKTGTKLCPVAAMLFFFAGAGNLAGFPLPLRRWQLSYQTKVGGGGAGGITVGGPRPAALLRSQFLDWGGNGGC